MAFPWKTDVGQSSIAAIQELARSSGIKFSVSSSYRAGDPGYHGSQNAVDMVATSADMAKLAAYLYQYSPYLLELIHSGGGGYFVKDGTRGFHYNADIVKQHFDHVHCATTLTALKAASDGKLTIPAGSTGKGCGATTAAIILSPIFITLGGLLCLITR